MTVVVHQVVPSLTDRDAIGHHVRRLSEALDASGVENEVWSDDARASLARPVRSPRRIPTTDRGVVVYHASTGTDLQSWLLTCPMPVLINYHNITEARFFDRWSPAVSGNMRRARQQVAELSPRAFAGVADSGFNATELAGWGCPRVAVRSIIVDRDALGDPVAKRHGGPLRLLFVGRIAPNKCQHDVIATLAAVRALVDPGARLTLVGSSSSERYRDALLALAAELGQADAIDWRAGLEPAELARCYADADVFVCASEHEGFGVPLIEAMHHRVPVVAFGATAVPETVGDAAILLDTKDPLVWAEAVRAVVSDDVLRADLVDSGVRRAAAVDPAAAAADLVDWLSNTARDALQSR